MRKICKQVSATICAVLLLFSTTACKIGDKPSNSTGNSWNSTIIPNYPSERETDVYVPKMTSKSSAFTQGTHVYNYTDTSDYLVKNNQSDYAIVIPQTTERVVLAAEELQLLFLQATGVKLPIVNDSDVTYSGEAKYISIGNTKLLQDANVKVPTEQLNQEGYIIKTVGKCIFITGNTENGCLFGTYGFLALEFDFDTFSNNCYYINEGVQSVSLKKYDVIDVPDMQTREKGCPLVSGEMALRMRYSEKDYSNTKSGGTYHIYVFRSN